MNADHQHLRHSPKPGTKVKLKDFDPDDTSTWNKVAAVEETKRLQKEMFELQNRLYAGAQKSLLIILQAMDAAGKDGTIRKVFEGINPQGVHVTSFKVPSSNERAHDFLWRVHQMTPARGYIAVFNRSHYEDVLIARVQHLVPDPIWKARYDHITNFERLLHDNETHILKFYLHISKDEQKERLQARLDDPEKNWKFEMGDLGTREKWDDYMVAYEDAIGHCNTDFARWYIVPANKKWYRDLVIAQAIVAELQSMDLRYPAAESGLDKVVIPD